MPGCLEFSQWKQLGNIVPKFFTFTISTDKNWTLACIACKDDHAMLDSASNLMSYGPRKAVSPEP